MNLLNRKMKTFIIPLLLISLLFGCNPTSKSKKEKTNLKAIQLNYAKCFEIEQGKDFTLLRILNTNDTSRVNAEFILRPQNYNKPLGPNEIKVPCKRIICLSSTQLAYLIELNDMDNVVGINSSRHLFNETIQQKVEAGQIKKVGKEGNFDIETILSLSPDIIFVSPFKTGGYDALQNLGIPLVPMAAYGEETPLGRAEWIKMMALFTSDYNKADSVYSIIETEYLRLKALTKNVQYRPTVMSGKMKGGTWYVAGGNSFFAHYFRDAGADYVIKDNKTGAVPMDYESVYNLGHNADYWRLLTSSPEGFNKEALKAEDDRYTTFKAYQTGNILVCNLREVPYREESCIKPQVLLADYIHHFHPELLPDYKPYFWQKIDD